MPTHADFTIDLAIREARRSVDASVVVGGSVLADPASLKRLYAVAERGVAIRLLFPSPNSEWLRSLARGAQADVEVYCQMVAQAGARAAASLPGATIRCYDTPGPCWFVLVDGSVLFTKPFDASRPTVPVRERREEHVEHFGLIFEQLWQRATDDWNRPACLQDAPPLVYVVSMSAEVIRRLAAAPAELGNLSPEAFELLVADRLSAMGLGVQRVGSSNTRDGGIDMVAWPERNAAIPYLLAVQVKHSGKNRAVPQSVVRDLKGVLSTVPLDIGLLVTNTRFSPDARWFAREKPNIVRLRDFDDLVRWLRSDFTFETIERDLPREILLGPGLRIPIGGK
jgi:hypothetical protein